jgi:dihydrofolate reductase
MISLIAAMANNRIIGKNGRVPWRLPADLKYFKKTTMDHMVIMGRKTFQSLGKPLAGRKNVILTHNTKFSNKECIVIYSVDDSKAINEAIMLAGSDEAFVIGGEQIYNLFIDYADKLYITHIDADFDGDTYFPRIDLDKWEILSLVPGDVDKDNLYPHQFVVYGNKRMTIR